VYSFFLLTRDFVPPNQNKLLLAGRLLLLVAGPRNELRFEVGQVISARSTVALALSIVEYPCFTTTNDRECDRTEQNRERILAGGERGEELVIESQQVLEWWR
jgi:hypothetical protein